MQQEQLGAVPGLALLLLSLAGVLGRDPEPRVTACDELHNLQEQTVNMSLNQLCSLVRKQASLLKLCAGLSAHDLVYFMSMGNELKNSSVSSCAPICMKRGSIAKHTGNAMNANSHSLWEKPVI